MSDVNQDLINLAEVGNLPGSVYDVAAKALNRIEELEAALKSLADDDWWDMETPSTAADFAKAALQHQRIRHE